MEEWSVILFAINYGQREWISCCLKAKETWFCLQSVERKCDSGKAVTSVRTFVGMSHFIFFFWGVVLKLSFILLLYFLGAGTHKVRENNPRCVLVCTHTDAKVYVAPGVSMVSLHPRENKTQREIQTPRFVYKDELSPMLLPFVFILGQIWRPGASLA